MYSKVVVPLDGSELAESVLPQVAEVIRARGSQVYLLAVAPLTGRTARAIVDLPAMSTPEQRQRIERELLAYLQIVSAKLQQVVGDVQKVARFGRPADEIIAFAGEVDADLIAMTTHGRSGIGRWVFGSVAERVLRGATCPVLLVRAGQPQPQAAYQHILIPLDGSEPAEQVLPYVKALIHANQTRVFLISVLTNGFTDRTVTLLTSHPRGLYIPTTALSQVEAQLHVYLRSVAAALRQSGAAVHTVIRWGPPADEILAYAAEVDADLIGMTAHGLSGVSRWVYGNVAGKVLQGAQCPVLLVRPTDT